MVRERAAEKACLCVCFLFLLLFLFLGTISCAWMPSVGVKYPEIACVNNSLCVKLIGSNVRFPLHLGLATAAAAAGRAGQHRHEQDQHCRRANGQYHYQLSLRRTQKLCNERELTLTDEGQQDKESSQLYRVGIGQTLQL